MSVSVKIKETNTTPIAVHGAGASKRVHSGIYQTILKEFLNNQEPISLDREMDLTVVSWKGGKYKNQETLIETMMRYYDFPILMLEYPDNVSFWEGTTKAKVLGTLDALQNDVIKTKYVMWCDCSDVILLEHPLMILDKYKEIFPAKFVFNSERNHYPKDARLSSVSDVIRDKFKNVYNYDVNKNHTTFKYLNSGLAIGETKILKELLEHSVKYCGVDERPFIPDQMVIRMAQYDMRDKVVTDDLCKLFVCLYNGPINEQEIHIEDVEITMKEGK
jgi:hypothetical protein